MRSPVDVVTPSLLNPAPPALLLHAYRIRLRTTGPVHFSAFPGPVLRGALGDDPAVYAAAVRWLEVPRYSRTQRTPMSFGGWMGWVRYEGDTAAWGALLRAAELLHVGKHAAFGFGWVRLAERAAG